MTASPTKGSAQKDDRHEARDLGNDRKVRRHRGGGTLVDVRGVDVHRNGRDLEEDSQQAQCHADQGEVGQAGFTAEQHRDLVADVEQNQASSGSVEQGESVEEGRGAHRAEEEVLDGGLVGATRVSAECDHHIGRKHRKFEGQEQPDQIGRIADEHHADEAEQEEGMVFTTHHAQGIEPRTPGGDRPFVGTVDGA